MRGIRTKNDARILTRTAHSLVPLTDWEGQTGDQASLNMKMMSKFLDELNLWC